MTLSKQDVLDRIRPLYVKASKEGTGVSIILSDDELSLISVDDLATLREEVALNNSGKELL